MSIFSFSDTYRRLRSYLHNFFWIIGEKTLSIGLSLLATVVVARYLGPEDFGLLAYALSLVALFSAAGHMGLSGLVVREIVKSPDNRDETLGTALGLKFMGMLIGYLALIVYAIAYEGVDTNEFYLIAIAGGALLFRPLTVIEFWFQAFVQARYVAIAEVASQTAATALKFGLVLTGSGVIYFATANLLHAFLVSLLLVFLFRLKSTLRISDWRFSKQRAKELLSQGWVIYLGSFLAIINLKVDQVMLRWLTSASEVGQYAIAAQLSEAWYFVPAAIVATIFPKLVKLREEDEALFYHRLQQLFDALFIIALLVAAIMTVLSDWLVGLFFGADYAQSAGVLVIHTWAAIFVFMRAAVSKWILIENALYFSLITQGMGALANVVMNYFLIPAYGGHGAAYATLLSYAMASFISLSLSRHTRRIFWLMLRAMFSPIRYTFQFTSIR